MANTTSATSSTAVDKTTGIIFGIMLLLLAITAIVLNSITIAVFSRVNRIFKNYFLGTRALIINLAVSDLLLILFYTLPTIAVSCGVTSISLKGNPMCTIQIFVAYTIVALNMHMIAALSVERFLKFFHPQLHELVFTDTTMTILIIGLWIFDIVVGLLPIIGWGAIEFYDNQLQCSFDYVLSVSYQNFSFVVIFVIPLVLTIALSIAIVVKVHKMILSQGHVEGIKLGGDENAKDTYITKLVKLQIYLATLPRKKAKKNTRKRVGRRQKVQDPTMPGYGSDSSSDEEITVTTLRKDEKKTFKFRRSDYVTALTYLACSVTIFLCWFMYIVLNYVNTHSLSTNLIASTIWLISIYLTHLCGICKPILYFSQNYKFRLVLVYGLRPWLYKEGPIDLREEMDSAKNGETNQTESVEDSTANGENEAYTNYAYEHPL